MGGDIVKSEYIEPEGFEIILSAMKKDNAFALRLSLATGLRISDVLALKPPQAVNRGGTWYIETTAQKTGKPVCAPVSEALARGLTRRRGFAWVFPSPKNSRKHRTRQAVWADVKAACKRLGIAENVTPHSARKIFAVGEFKKRGLQSVQDELQHDRVTTTLLYAFADVLTKNAGENDAKKHENGAIFPQIVEKFVENLEKELGGFSRIQHALQASLSTTFRMLGGCEIDNQRKRP